MSRTGGRPWLLAFVTAAVVCGLDQLSKAIVASSLVPGERRDFLPLVDVVHVRNTGVAFGALGGRGWLVPLLATVAAAGVLIWFASNPDRPGGWLPAGLVLGGAAGNLIDRVRLGAVTDFIKLPHWPAFNLADVAITAGVIALLIVAERSAGSDGD